MTVRVVWIFIALLMLQPGLILAGGEVTIVKRSVREAPITYPPEAIRRRITGTVTVRATIGPDGHVLSVSRVGTGPAVLFGAVANAVIQWRFTIPAPNTGRRYVTDVTRTFSLVYDPIKEPDVLVVTDPDAPARGPWPVVLAPGQLAVVGLPPERDVERKGRSHSPGGLSHSLLGVVTDDKRVNGMPREMVPKSIENKIDQENEVHAEIDRYEGAGSHRSGNEPRGGNEGGQKSGGSNSSGSSGTGGGRGPGNVDRP